MSKTINETLALLGRILIAIIFVESGIDKIPHAAMIGHMMSTKGIPGFLIWAVIALEIGGGLALAFGLLTRLSAAALAVFSILAINIFLMSMKNRTTTLILMEWAMVGGLLSYIAHGGGLISLDRLLRKGRGPAAPTLEDSALAPRSQ